VLRPTTRSALILVVSAVALPVATGCFQGRPYNLGNDDTGTTEPPPGCVPEECDGVCCDDVCVEDIETNEGHCGECFNSCAHYETCVDGDCTCTPDCNDKVCGDNQCGGSCGDCQDGEVCSWREDSSSCIDADAGCSDGAREGFTDIAAFPDIASCEASWPIQGLRGSLSGVACGNDLDSECNGPRDACAEGWHICAFNGFPDDVRDRATGSECASAVAGDGVFVIASDYDDGTGACDDTPFDCSPARVAMCCGSGCETAVISCIWPTDTGAVTGTFCSSVSDADGVVCCRDPAVGG
jgi:hypothetical protein